MGLLTGLGGLGLGNLESMSLYEDPRRSVIADEQGETNQNANEEADFLLSKSYTCFACGKSFKSLAMKSNRAKLLGTDMDLRPRYDKVEPLKYDVIMCPGCGCASLTRYWRELSQTQYTNVREKIGRTFVHKSFGDKFYTYEEAFERYQMALANACVKQVRNSEKAYICLKTGWLLRAQAESLDPSSYGYTEKIEELKEKETEFLRNALDGFVLARSSESFPICGMDENTVDYLLSALFIEFKEYDQATKLVSNLIVSGTASSRIKDKARMLKEEIKKNIK